MIYLDDELQAVKCSRTSLFKRKDGNAQDQLKLKTVSVSPTHITIWKVIGCLIDTHETKLSTSVYLVTHNSAAVNAIIIEPK